MSYSIHITATAERDILRAADYIEFTLKNPTAAEHLLDAATKQINSLSDMPEIPVKQKNQSSADYHTGCRKQ